MAKLIALLYLALAVVDCDGLCAPDDCDPAGACRDGAPCHHGVCLTPCDQCPETGRCRSDGVLRFCADADSPSNPVPRPRHD